MVRWRWPVLIVSLMVFMGLGLFAATQRYHDPYDIWFLRDDPHLVTYRQLTRQYDDTDVIIVAFRDPAGIFTNRALEAILHLTALLELTPLVQKVNSLTNYQFIRARTNEEDEEELRVGDFVTRQELPLSDEDLQARQRMALAEKPVVGSLLSARDAEGKVATTTAVLAHVKLEARERAVDAVTYVRSAAAAIEKKHGYRVYVTGVPVVEEAFITAGSSETALFLPLLVVTVAVLLGVAFRRILGVVLPLGVFALSVAPALGVMALRGMWLNAMTTIIPQVLITVGIAEAVHLVSTYFEVREQGAREQGAVVRMVERNLVPCLVTSLTTALGFASLLAASVVPLQQLGFGAALGTIFAWVLSFTFVPAALAVWPSHRDGRRRVVTRVSPIAWDRAVTVLVRLVGPRPRTVVTLMSLFFLGIGLFVIQLRIETSYENMFKPETPLRVGIAFTELHLGGTADIELSIDSGRPDGVNDPRFLQKLESIETFLAAQREISYTSSILDILKRVNQAMHNDDPAYHRLPDTTELSAQYLLLYTLSSGQDDLKDRIDVDNRWTRISARSRTKSSEDTQALGERVHRFLREGHPDLTAHVTGKALLYTALHEKLRDSTINSFATAFIPITVLLALLFRSVKIGLLSMIPNVLPIAATYGLMGLLGIPLDPGSALVASVGLGITLDDTVHFFSNYLVNSRAGASPQEAVTQAFREVGRPVTYTTVILALGFSLFSFSQFNFIAYFGQLATCVIVLALLADLLLTPAMLLLITTKPRPASAGPTRRRARAAIGIGLIVVVMTLVGWVRTAVAGPAEDRGLTIVQEQDRINSGYRDEIARHKMVLINANGDRSERILEFRTLEGPAEGDKTLIVFLAPADINGTALLTHEKKSGDDDQWLYLPALRRIKRIASSSKASSFVGSEFTYEDMTPRELTKYQWKYLRDDAVGGMPVWLVESVPLFKGSGYVRMELAIQHDNHQTIRINLYDQKGDLVKVCRFEEWSKVDGKWWRARSVRMENVQTRKSTILETLEVKIGNGLGAHDFSKQKLERQ